MIIYSICWTQCDLFHCTTSTEKECKFHEGIWLYNPQTKSWFNEQGAHWLATLVLDFYLLHLWDIMFVVYPFQFMLLCPSSLSTLGQQAWWQYLNTLGYLILLCKIQSCSCRPVIKNEKLTESFIAYVFLKHMGAQRRIISFLYKQALTQIVQLCVCMCVCVTIIN